MMKCWMVVASKMHVARGVDEGFAQVCHGKGQPLKRMNVGDGIIYYSPKIEFEKPAPCQEFTAIGKVVGNEIYQVDMGGGFIPFRKDVEYNKLAISVSIKPLLTQLNFIEDTSRWGYKFRFGLFEISVPDYLLIEEHMTA